MTAEDGPSDALERARLQRAGLRHAVVEVEAALATPAVGDRVSGWVSDVGAALRDLQAAFNVHIAITEDPDGILGQIVQIAPRLAGPCDRLRREHVELQGLLGEQIALFNSPPTAPDGPWIEGRRREAMQVLGRLANHRQQGADLTYEAYGVDIGGET